MKIFRIICLLIFLLTVIIFGGYKKIESKSRDTLGPEIIFTSDSIEVSVNTPTERFLEGVTATDEKDGNVTDSILIEDISNITEDGKRIITYVAFDSSNHITKAERQLQYTDYTPPRFKLSQPLRFQVGDTNNLTRYMTVQDSLDGELTDKIKYEGIQSGFGKSEGSYEMEFQVMNSAGDMSYLPTKVEFYYPGYQKQEYVPEITLSEYIVYCKVGDLIKAKDYLIGVTIGVENYSFQDASYPEIMNVISKDEIKINSNVNRKVPGVYDIEYSMTTVSGYTGTTRLLVVVEE